MHVRWCRISSINSTFIKYRAFPLNPAAVEDLELHGECCIFLSTQFGLHLSVPCHESLKDANLNPNLWLAEEHVQRYWNLHWICIWKRCVWGLLFQGLWKYMDVSKNNGNPQIIHFNRVFHEINHPFWGTPNFRKHPYIHQRFRLY